jgi:hypothetical protein
MSDPLADQKPHCTCEVGMGTHPGDHHEVGCQLNPAPHNPTHPVGRRSVTGVHHADDCPMRSPGATGCVCGREGERDAERETNRLLHHITNGEFL